MGKSIPAANFSDSAIKIVLETKSLTHQLALFDEEKKGAILNSQKILQDKIEPRVYKLQKPPSKPTIAKEEDIAPAITSPTEKFSTYLVKITIL